MNASINTINYGVITCAYLLIIAKIVTYYTYLLLLSKVKILQDRTVSSFPLVVVHKQYDKSMYKYKGFLNYMTVKMPTKKWNIITL